MKSILVGIPVLDNIGWKFFLWTTTLVAKLAKTYRTEFCLINRAAIDRARQMIVETAITKECDRLLFIDDDTILPLDVVERLNLILEADLEKRVSASGICYQRGHPYFPMLYRWKDFKWGLTDDGSCQIYKPFPAKPFRVSANGMGISLLNVPLLKVIQEKQKPCFDRVGPGTEDFVFYEKAHRCGFESWADARIEGIHLGDPVEISSHNADGYRSLSMTNYLPDGGSRAQIGEVTL